jgi:hypothetical protein
VNEYKVTYHVMESHATFPHLIVPFWHARDEGFCKILDENIEEHRSCATQDVGVLDRIVDIR